MTSDLCTCKLTPCVERPSSPQMLRRYGASARSARARRTYDRIMTDKP
jgi:hypothetical protein